MYFYCYVYVFLLYVYIFFRANRHSSATLTEGFPCFFLGCKANARVKPVKIGHGLHSSKIFLLFYILLVLCRSVYCLCVNVYCTTAIGWLPNCSEQMYHIISYHDRESNSVGGKKVPCFTYWTPVSGLEPWSLNKKHQQQTELKLLSIMTQHKKSLLFLQLDVDNSCITMSNRPRRRCIHLFLRIKFRPLSLLEILIRRQ